MTNPRLVALALATALVATSCVAGNGSTPSEAQSATIEVAPAACSADPTSSSPSTVENSGLNWLRGQPYGQNVPEPLVPLTGIVSVLAADGIPAIDAPTCLPVAGVGFLEDDAPVVAIEVNGDARAYPLEILTWHELVNDTIGGEPITISYCPLCNSAIAYDRRVGDSVLDFGTSGALKQSSMVMYDRQTETLWTHFNGQAVSGDLTGTQLSFRSSSVVSWAEFRREFPDGLVLSRETGFSRDYGRNPYPGYEENADPFARFITDAVDPRLAPKLRVVGVVDAGDAVAIAHDQLFADGVVSFALGGRSLVAWNQLGTASALDGVSVSGGDDVGATAVFVSSADGDALTFERTLDGFTDVETGSAWNIFGRATSGALAGTQLDRVVHVDTFWFAWGSFYPDTDIVG